MAAKPVSGCWVQWEIRHHKLLKYLTDFLAIGFRLYIREVRDWVVLDRRGQTPQRWKYDLCHISASGTGIEVLSLAA